MRKFLLTLFICIPFGVQSQTEAGFDYYLELISELSSRDEEETDFNDFAYELSELWESPVDLNTAQSYELARLFWLSEQQLNNLIAYVEKQRPIASIYELSYIPGFDSTLVVSMQPFITISGNNTTNRFGNRSKQMLLLRTGKTIEQQQGYREKKFEGDAWKHNLRYKYQYGDKISAGFNLEKDAGETLFKGSNKAGPDLYSGYIRVNNVGIFKSINVGHFAVGCGQGLVAGPGFALGKSSQAVNLIQKETGVRSFTSNDENRFMQGVATTVTINSFETSLFLSYKKIDANVTLEDSSRTPLEVSSLQITGLHSTASEVADENSLAEFTAGGRVLYKKSQFQTGITFIHSSFNATLKPTPTDYNRYYFKGDNQSNIGVDYKYNFSNTTIFGEEAVDAQGNPAFLNGLTTNIGSRMQMSILHRYYSRAYHSFYGNAFGENSRVQNEEGIYGGMSMSLARHVNLAVYADYFRFPWLKSGVDAPSYGREFLVHAEYRPVSSFSGYVQFRYKQKQTNAADSLDVTNSIVQSSSQRIRFHLQYLASDQLSLSSRLEIGSYSVQDQKKDKSYLFYQDVKYSMVKIPIQLNLRFAVFDTDSYNSRIYAYENDVLYAFSVSSYYLKGQRYYAMVKYSPAKYVDLWLKYSQSLYPDEKTLGSGLYQIDGNSKSDIRVQAIVKF